VPLPLLPVVGACVDCRLLLLVEPWLEEVVDDELELVVVPLDVVVLSAVLEELVFPAYEAAAA
jgi:hypothetical protein